MIRQSSDRWSAAPALWQARASVVGFVKVVGDPRHHALVLGSCARLIRRDERFAKTGVGWILRDLSKVAQSGGRRAPKWQSNWKGEAQKNGLAR